MRVISLVILAALLFMGNVTAQQVTAVRDMMARLAYQSNYSTVSKQSIDCSVFTSINSTLTSSMSIGVNGVFRSKISPISFIGFGLKAGKTYSSDHAFEAPQINVPDSYGQFSWLFESEGTFLNPTGYIGGQLGLPDYGKKLTFTWGVGLGYRLLQVDKVKTWNMFKGSPELKGDRWYEAGQGLSSVTFEGLFRANYYVKQKMNIYAQLGIEGFSNQATLGLREKFGYTTDKSGGMGGAATLQLGIILSFDGFGNFDNASRGMLTPQEKKSEQELEIEKKFFPLELNGVAKIPGKLWTVVANDPSITKMRHSSDGVNWSEYKDSVDGIWYCDINYSLDPTHLYLQCLNAAGLETGVFKIKIK